MPFIKFNFSALRLVRILLTVCVCAFLAFSYATPAYSASGIDTPQPTAKSKPAQQGEANLLDIEREAQEAVLKDPYSREKTQATANEGLNEIQGTANVENMKRPENTQATSVEENSKSFLERITGQK